MAASNKSRDQGAGLNLSLEATYFPPRAFKHSVPTTSDLDSTSSVATLEAFTAAERDIVLRALTYVRKKQRAEAVENSFGLMAVESGYRQAVAICLKYKAEETACSLIQSYPGDFPVCLVHLAGEKQQFAVLKCLRDCMIPIKANKTVANAQMKLCQLLKHKQYAVPYISQSRFISGMDILRWACVSGEQQLVWY